LPQRPHRHELKKLFQQWQVPPWERDRVPLIYIEDELVAVVGYLPHPLLDFKLDRAVTAA
jgi:tRNA(Ile)-lysidine synthetase-like protein